MNHLKLKSIAALSVMICVSAPLARADFNPQRAGISYSYPTNYANWENAFPAGNGNMGVMVFGNPLNETVIYDARSFNLAADTNSYVRSFAQVSAEDLATIRSNCAAGNFAAANKLAVESAHYHGGGEGNRHPGYEMLIAVPEDGAVTDYSRVCDFSTGVITVKWHDNRGDWERKTFVSRQDDVIVQYLTAPTQGKLNCLVQLDTNPHMGLPSSMRFASLASADFLNLRAKYSPRTGDAGYEGVTRVVAVGGTRSVDGSVLNISNATSVILLTKIAKYYTNCVGQWDEELLQKELAKLPTDYNKLLKGQIATHGAIYKRVQLDLNASKEERAKSNEELLAEQKNSNVPVKALWERIFDAGRYYYLSSSSSNTPPDLLGIWTGDCNAGWGGFYHLDANLNLQVDQGNIGDMPEAMAGYFHLNEVWQKDFEVNALKLLGCRGMVAAGNTPGLTSGLMAGISDFYPYQYATGEEGWLLYPFWEHYLITGDTNFLRNQFYPLIKDMGYFYEDFLTEKDTNGNYILAGSVSPENQPSNIRISLLNNSAFDVSGAKFCLSALIETCNTLGLDQGAGQGVEKWSNLLSKLPPYLIGEPNNSVGALAEWGWPGIKDSLVHRHMSQLLPVWPFREITPEATPELFQAASVVLAKKDGYHETAGHGILHGALIAANLKNAKSVNKRLLQLMKEDYYYDTLISSHNNKHGTFCTDTCNAVPGIMMEMLVCSSPGILELLPALPATLDAGAISGVKGRNRVTVQNLAWNTAERSVKCTLKSDVDQIITLIERDGIENIESRATIGNSPLGKIAKTIQLKTGKSVDVSITLGNLRAVETATEQPTAKSLSLNRPVSVSSVADDSPGANAVDGDENTRWSSAYNDDEWIYVDLGSVKHLSEVKLNWETAYAKAYKIQVSDDAAHWKDAYSVINGNGGTEKIQFDAKGRYVRMLGLQRATTFGYSLWEFEVYGQPD